MAFKKLCLKQLKVENQFRKSVYRKAVKVEQMLKICRAEHYTDYTDFTDPA